MPVNELKLNNESGNAPQVLKGHWMLAWLIPGFAFWQAGMRPRAVFLFGILQATFIMGCLLRGSVVLPDLAGGADGFNIVSILVFCVQMGNGGLGLISLIPEILGPGAAVLPTNEAAAYADLGQMFLLVSGGMNYFLVMAALSGSLGTVQTVPTEVEQGEGR